MILDLLVLVLLISILSLVVECATSCALIIVESRARSVLDGFGTGLDVCTHVNIIIHTGFG